MSVLQKFGIRGRMFFAFGVIASVTIITSVIAWIAYERLGNSVRQIARKDIVAVSLAAELAEKGGAITATAPALVAAANESERMRDWAALSQTLLKMDALVDRIFSGKAQQQDRDFKKNLLNAVSSNLRELDVVVRQQFWFTDRNQELSDRLRWAHADLLDEVDPMIDDARFKIGLGLERTGTKTNEGISQGESELKQQIAQQEALLHIKAAGNLLVGLIARAATMSDKKTLENTRKFALEIAEPIASDFVPLKRITGTLSLRQSFNSLLGYISGEDSLFDFRRDELALKEKGLLLLAENRKLVQTLQDELASHVAVVNAQARSAANQSAEFVNRTKLIFVAAAVGSIVISILVVWLYVGRNLVGRITALDASMRQIARGNLNTSVPSGGDDEIADMADALSTFRDTLSETQAELVQAGKLAALGQLSAGIAHELNQPLAAIRSRAHSAEVLLERRKEEGVRDNLMSISSLAMRMASKINHLKTLARKPSRKMGVVELGAVVAESLDILQSRISSEGVVVVNQLKKHEIFVKGGAIRLEQVLLNIFGNALDAMQNVKHRQLTISADQNRDDVLIRIADTGSGIDQAIAGQVFDPFFTTKDVGEGLGLGLSISYNIIKDLGGSIRVQSQPDEGTTFLISLNRAAELVPA